MANVYNTTAGGTYHHVLPWCILHVICTSRLTFFGVQYGVSREDKKHKLKQRLATMIRFDNSTLHCCTTSSTTQKLVHSFT